MGRIRPSTLFYPAWHLVSIRQQCQALAYLLRGSYIYTVLNYTQPFEDNHEAHVAPGENEFDTPHLDYQHHIKYNLNPNIW